MVLSYNVDISHRCTDSTMRQNGPSGSSHDLVLRAAIDDLDGHDLVAGVATGGEYDGDKMYVDDVDNDFGNELMAVNIDSLVNEQ